MSQLVLLDLKGSREEVERILKEIRNAMGTATTTVWLAPRWEPKDSGTEYDSLDDTFEIEVLGVHKRVDAVDRVRTALETVDPTRQIVKGGDIDKTQLEL